MTLAVGAGALLGAEALWWRFEAGSPRSYAVLDPGLRDLEDVFRDGADARFSANDRALIGEDWMIFPDEQFAYAVDATGTAGAEGPSAAPAQEAGGRGLGAVASAVVRSVTDGIAPARLRDFLAPE